MKNRVICGSVTVTGPPAAICRLKVGMTLPLLPRTLPKRTAQYCLPSGAYANSNCSPTRLVAPMTLAGATALSVDMKTKCSAWNSRSSFKDVLRAEDVRRHRLDNVGLENRHVLMRGCVEDDLGLPAREHLEHGVSMRDVGENLFTFAVGQLANVVQMSLVMVEHDQDIRVES